MADRAPQRRNRLTLALLMCAALMIVVSPSGIANAAVADGRIAFQGCDDNGCQIYTVNADGRGLRQVTPGGVNFLPDWSPDGSHIVYTAALPDEPLSLWIVDADGQHARQLMPAERDSLFAHFTPSGKAVVFTDFTGDGDGGIFSVRPDGTHRRVITPNSGNSYNDAVVSPDGHTIAFLRWHVRNVRAAIYTLPRRGGPQTSVTPPALEAWAPEWAPDGTSIVVASHVGRDEPNGAIYSTRPDGTHLKKLTHPAFPLEDYTPSYSPSGERIVFASDRRYPDRNGSDLFTMRPDGSHIRRIPLPSSIVYAEWPQWGPATDLGGPATAAERIRPSGNPAATRLEVCGQEWATLVFRFCVARSTR